MGIKMAQNTDWLNNFESVDAPVTNAGALVVPGTPEKPEKPEETFRFATEAEKIAERLDPKRSYQISNTTGKFLEVAGQSTATPAGTLDPKTIEGRKLIARGILSSVGVDPTGGVDPVSEMIRKSTSGGLQKLGAELVGDITGEPTPGMVEIGRLRAIASDMTLQMSGGSLGAGMSNTDRDFINDRMGDVANPDKTAGERLAAWGEVKKRLLSVAELQAGEQAAGGGGGVAAPPPLQVATGATFSTDQDIANAMALNQLWANGATIDQMNAKSIELTTSPLSQASIEFLQRNINNRNIPAVSPASSGKREGGVPSELSAVGAGLFRGATANLGEELVNVFDPAAAAKLQAASEFAQSESPYITAGSELIGGVLSPLARVGNLARGASPIAQEALSGAVYGTLYGAGEADPNAGIRDRLSGAFIGGATGGAGGALGGKIAQSLGGGSAATQEAVQAAERAGIPVMASDVVPPATFAGKAIQQAGERIPLVGTGGMREAQQQARGDAVTQLLNEYGVNDPTLANKVATSLSNTRKAEIKKYKDMKDQVINPLASAGVVPVNNAIQAIDDQILQLSRRATPAADEAIAELQNIKNTLQGRDLFALEAYRADELSKAFADEAKFSVAARDIGEKALRAIYDPVRKDMGEFIRAKGGPNDFVKWKVANKKLADGADELRNTTLKAVLKDADQKPEAVWRLLFSSKPSEVATLYRNLDAQGKASARSAIMDKVFRDIAGDGGTIDDVTPEKFVNAMRKQGAQLRIFFKGDEADRVQGLIKALKLTSRAGQANVMTQSGQQAVPILGAAGLAGAVSGFLGDAATGFTTGLSTIAAAGTIGGLARILESGPVKNALLAMQKAKPIDQNKAAQRVIEAIRAASAQAGGNLPSSEPMPQ
jgi:hypothetical protein